MTITFFILPNLASGGGELSVFSSYLKDERERDIYRERRYENIAGPKLFKEPEIYPTYLVYPKAYKTGEEVVHQGVYITDSPYKSIALYTNQYEHFIEASVDGALSILDQSITRVNGNLEYGLYDPVSPYNIDPNKTDEDEEISGEIVWVESEFYYVKEIPPNTEGVPNNPLRLEHLRYPLKENEHFPTIAELQAKSGFVYQHPHYKVETYNQVVNRYEKFYSNYLLEHGVDEALLKDYTER